MKPILDPVPAPLSQATPVHTTTALRALAPAPPSQTTTDTTRHLLSVAPAPLSQATPTDTMTPLLDPVPAPLSQATPTHTTTALRALAPTVTPPSWGVAQTSADGDTDTTSNDGNLMQLLHDFNPVRSTGSF